jgi:hypothetical protein
VQGLKHFFAWGSQCLGGAVQIKTVPAFVLDLCHQDRLTVQGGGASDPIALGLHANHFGVRVLGHLAEYRFAEIIRHPVLGFNALVVGHPFVKYGLVGIYFNFRHRLCFV